MGFYVKRAAVIGSGVMGASIAALMAGTGIEVLLLDIVPNKLTEKEENKGLALKDKVVRNRIVNEGKQRILNPKMRAIYDKKFGVLIKTGNIEDDIDKIKNCDLIIEAVLEKIDIKQNIMEKIAEFKKEDAVVATNTSGLSINKIVEKMPVQFKKRFMGTHFFNPPRYMRLLEIIPAEETDKELIKEVNNFFEKRLGKKTIITKDTPNFVANRIGTYAMAQAMSISEKYGFSVYKTDQLTGKIIKRASSATFKTADLVGIDLLNNVSENTVQVLQDKKEKEAQQVPAYIKDMIGKGYIGNKAKKGFYAKQKTSKGTKKYIYDYKSGEYVELQKEKIEAIEEAKKAGKRQELLTLMYGEREENKYVWEITKNLLINCAERIPEISDDYKQIDIAMKCGYNWQLGPFELWDAIGLKKSVEKMKAEGEKIPEWVEKRLQEGKSFYEKEQTEAPYILLSSPKYKIIKENEDAILKDIGDNVACLQFKSKSNSLTEKVTNFIDESLKLVEKEDYKGLVIKNYGTNFCVGANLNMILGLSKDKKWDELEKIVKTFQYTCLKMKYAKKPVVVAPHGMALGGGAEVVLHGTRVVAHAESYIGLVEVGVGLVPGSGGIKELLFRTMKGKEKAPLCELTNVISPVFEMIAMAKVSSSAHDALKKGYLRETDRIVMNIDYQIDDAKKEIIHMYDTGFMPFIPYDIKVTGIEGKSSLRTIISFMKDGRFISKYDALLADKIAGILTGGEVLSGTKVTEEYILELERQTFLSLCGEEKTQERIAHMLKTGKPLRN